MAFLLNTVVPWGRTFNEYKNMFTLTLADIDKKIISFGDGPASFNVEMTAMGKCVTSVDPIYQFTTAQLRNRIDETAVTILEQMETNKDNFVWKSVKNVNDLKELRMGAMKHFLIDFENGLAQKRYVPHALPDQTNFKADEFELGLSSHFLLLYSGLGLNFHLDAIMEMMRICKEVRIFPVLTLDAKRPPFLDELLFLLRENYKTEIKTVTYEFQKGGNEILVIKRR